MDKRESMFLIIAVVVVIGIFAALSITGNAAGSPPTQCSDRIDNDGDAKCDYFGNRKGCTDGSVKGDAGCASASDNSEASCVSGSTTCGIGACQRSSICTNDVSSCTPGSPTTEICNNIDDDCDGSVDEALFRSCGTDVGECVAGNETCSTGAWGACMGSVGPSTEICDNKDNDCDGSVDDGIVCSNNTCSDTDGGFVWNVQGIVSGTYNSNPYSYTDNCMNSSSLQEYYCAGTTQTSSIVNCFQINSTCSAGRCI